MYDLIEQYHLSSFVQWLALLSVATFLLSVILIPVIISRLRQNFFIILDRRISIRKQRNIRFFALSIFRNLVGYFLLAAGILMLFLPGQGLITIVLGLLFISFPGKQKLFRRLIRIEKLQKTLDWFRLRKKMAPFAWPKVGQKSTNY